VTTEPAIVPMLAYADGVAAMDWLVSAFGFTERTRWLDDDGRLSHGELAAGSGLIMLASPSPDYQGPTAHRRECTSTDTWLRVPYVFDGVLAHVDDIEAHRARAESAGATLLSGIEDAPFGRLYRVEDLEGHRWMFLQPS
jgi:PhnB protein